MALDVLLQAIAEDGDAEARQVLAAAGAQAATIRAAADARAERRCAEACAAREAELRTELETRRARTRNETRIQVLLARARFIDRIFGEAEARLPGILERPVSSDALVNLCREALETFPPGRARIRCRAELARRLGESLGSIAVVTDESVAEGVIAETIDGSARVDNTLAAMLRRRRPELSIAILEAMSEKE